jgi:zinc transport system substrate-binding protein
MLMACKKEEQSENKAEDSKPKIASVNYPLHYFAQRIGGDQIKVIFPLPADVDPAYWQPNVAAISLFQQADVIFLNGVGYAKWIDKVSLPTSRMINTSDGYKKKYIELVEGMTHSHGPEGDHVHKGYAFTTWLNIKLAIEQATMIKEHLVRIIPGQNEYLNMNFNELKTDLGTIDQDLSEVTKNLQNKNIFGSHPVYQYLANGYGLTIRSEHWEPDQLPSAEQWAVFKDKLVSYPGKIMLWEGQPLPEVENQLASLGIVAVVFNPCANKPDSGDFLSVMKQNLINLKAAL